MDIPELDSFLTTIEQRIATDDASSHTVFAHDDPIIDQSLRTGDARHRLSGPERRDPNRAYATSLDPLPVRNLADIPAQPLTWLWPGWLPAANLTILGGHVGDGKSTVIAALVAALTTGDPLPDGAIAPIGNVLILSAEDHPARVIRPRLDRAGADLHRVFILDDADLRHDTDRLQDVIRSRNISLLVIDPLSSLLRRADRASEGDIREALRPLMSVIEQTGVAVLGVMRIGKSGAGRRPAQRLVGSSAVPGIARSVLMLARTPVNSGSATASATGSATGGATGSATDSPPIDDADPHRAVLQVVKSNYTSAPPPVALTLMPDGAVRWLGPASAGIDELAATGDDRRLSHSERADAADFLREYLAGTNANAANVLKQARALGFSEITIRRAKKDLGIISERDPFFRSCWTWRLPAEPKAPKPKAPAKPRSRSRTTSPSKGT